MHEGGEVSNCRSRCSFAGALSCRRTFPRSSDGACDGPCEDKGSESGWELEAIVLSARGARDAGPLESSTVGC